MSEYTIKIRKTKAFEFCKSTHPWKAIFYGPDGKKIDHFYLVEPGLHLPFDEREARLYAQAKNRLKSILLEQKFESRFPKQWTVIL